MKVITFFPEEIQTCIILRWEGKIKTVMNIRTVELTDLCRGISLPIIFFQ